MNFLILYTLIRRLKIERSKRKEPVTKLGKNDKVIMTKHTRA